MNNDNSTPKLTHQGPHLWNSHGGGKIYPKSKEDSNLSTNPTLGQPWKGAPTVGESPGVFSAPKPTQETKTSAEKQRLYDEMTAAQDVITQTELLLAGNQNLSPEEKAEHNSRIQSMNNLINGINIDLKNIEKENNMSGLEKALSAYQKLVPKPRKAEFDQIRVNFKEMQKNPPRSGDNSINTETPKNSAEAQLPPEQKANTIAAVVNGVSKENIKNNIENIKNTSESKQSALEKFNKFSFKNPRFGVSLLLIAGGATISALLPGLGGSFVTRFGAGMLGGTLSRAVAEKLIKGDGDLSQFARSAITMMGAVAAGSATGLAIADFPVETTVVKDIEIDPELVNQEFVANNATIATEPLTGTEVVAGTDAVTGGEGEIWQNTPEDPQIPLQQNYNYGTFENIGAPIETLPDGAEAINLPSDFDSGDYHTVKEGDGFWSSIQNHDSSMDALREHPDYKHLGSDTARLNAFLTDEGIIRDGEDLRLQTDAIGDGIRVVNVDGELRIEKLTFEDGKVVDAGYWGDGEYNNYSHIASEGRVVAACPGDAPSTGSGYTQLGQSQDDTYWGKTVAPQDVTVPTPVTDPEQSWVHVGGETVETPVEDFPIAPRFYDDLTRELTPEELQALRQEEMRRYWERVGYIDSSGSDNVVFGDGGGVNKVGEQVGHGSGQSNVSNSSGEQVGQGSG